MEGCNMQWSIKRKQKKIISRWFAWYPVKVSAYDYIWLEFVWKEKYYFGNTNKDYSVYYYKDKPEII